MRNLSLGEGNELSQATQPGREGRGCDSELILLVHARCLLKFVPQGEEGGEKHGYVLETRALC